MADPVIVDLGGGKTVEKPPEMSMDEFTDIVNAYKFEVETQQDLADGPKTDVSGLAASATRGIAPYAVAGGAGALAGSVVPGVGTMAGGAAGVGSMGLAQFVGDPLVYGVNKYFGTEFTQPTEALNKFFDFLGVQEPDTATEQFVRIVSEGAASGPAQHGRSLGKQIISGAAAGASGEAARATAESAGVGPMGQLGTALLAGGSVGMATQPRGPVRTKTGSLNLAEQSHLANRAAKGDEAARRTLASRAASGIDPETRAAADALGVSEYLTPGQLTTNKAFRELEFSMAQFPDSAVSDARTAGLMRTADSATKTVNGLFKGDAFDMSSSVARVKASLSKEIDALDAGAEGLYAKIRGRIDPKHRSIPKATLAHLEQRLEELGKKSNLSPLELRVYNRLKLGADGAPTYANLDDVRQMVGSALKGKGQFPTSDTAIAKNLYRLLTEDQGVAINKAGGNTMLWEAAKNTVRVRKSVEDSMSLLFGKELDKSMAGALESATTALAKGDAERLSKIMNAVPQQLRKDVAVNGITAMLTKNAKDGTLDFNNFVKWYGKVKNNKKAYNALFGHLDPEGRAGIDNIYTVSRTIDDAGLKNNAMYVAGAIQGSNSLMNKLYGAVERATGVVVGQELLMRGVGTRAAMYPLMYGSVNALRASKKTKALNNANRLIGSPEFMDLVRAMADGREVEQFVNKLTKSQAMITFARSANLSTKNDEVRNWIYGALDEQSK